jgi:tripartite-type tricarboxylate transporter receptor subunit TctC
VKRRLDELGLEVQGGSPEDFQKFIRNEVARLNRLIKIGALTPE